MIDSKGPKNALKSVETQRVQMLFKRMELILGMKSDLRRSRWPAGNPDNGARWGQECRTVLACPESYGCGLGGAPNDGSGCARRPSTNTHAAASRTLMSFPCPLLSISSSRWTSRGALPTRRCNNCGICAKASFCERRHRNRQLARP